MFEDRDMKVLLGNSIPEPEVDYDDEEVNSEYGKPVVESALMQYFFVTVIDYMQTSEFRENYKAVLPEIKKYSTKHQQLLAYSILQAIKNKYDFELSLNADANNQIEINETLELLEFIEYDNVEFIVEVWYYLKPDINNLNIENYCKKNEQKIIDEIEEQLSSSNYNWMIADFLKTYGKDDIVGWFCEKSKDLKTNILMKFIKE